MSFLEILWIIFLPYTFFESLTLFQDYLKKIINFLMLLIPRSRFLVASALVSNPVGILSVACFLPIYWIPQIHTLLVSMGASTFTHFPFSCSGRSQRNGSVVAQLLRVPACHTMWHYLDSYQCLKIKVGKGDLAAMLINKALVHVTPFRYSKFLILGGCSGSFHTLLHHMKISMRGYNSSGVGVGSLTCSYLKILSSPWEIPVLGGEVFWIPDSGEVGGGGVQTTFIPLTVSQPMLFLHR